MYTDEWKRLRGYLYLPTRPEAGRKEWNREADL